MSESVGFVVSSLGACGSPLLTLLAGLALVFLLEWHFRRTRLPFSPADQLRRDQIALLGLCLAGLLMPGAMAAHVCQLPRGCRLLYELNCDGRGPWAFGAYTIALGLGLLGLLRYDAAFRRRLREPGGPDTRASN